jgi:hypothetical protein
MNIIQVSLFILATLLFIRCLQYQSRLLNCTFINCSLESNGKDIDKETNSFACLSAGRPNWGRAYILTYILMIGVWIIFFQLGSVDIRFWFIGLFNFTLLYFYFNFDAYHLAYPRCLNGK